MSAPKVLIVEDEALISEDLRLLLVHNGCEVTGVAASGKEALQSAKENPPEVVLMDVKLKGRMNGVEAAIQIQETLDHPISFIFLSAYSEEWVTNSNLEHCAYIPKMFSEGEVVYAVKAAVEPRP